MTRARKVTADSSENRLKHSSLCGIFAVPALSHPAPHIPTMAESLPLATIHPASLPALLTLLLTAPEALTLSTP